MDLRTMLRSLAEQEALPSEVLIVDASAESNASVESEFPSLPISYVTFQGRPSAAAQRNEGARRVGAGTDLICFFDDDQVLLPGALREMLSFWAQAEETVGGAGFNLVNEVDGRPGWFKRSRLAEWLGLYSRQSGSVARSGWQALPGVLQGDLDVEWLTTGAVVLRREVFQALAFDEFFDGYSYLEDLDLTYTISRSQRLVLVAAAEVHHYPSPHGRISWSRFGFVEVRNRLYFVRKHGLSVASCLGALGIRFLMTLGRGIFMPWTRGLARAWGNLVGFARCVIPGSGA